MAERVDFAERLLAARRERPLGKGEWQLTSSPAPALFPRLTALSAMVAAVLVPIAIALAGHLYSRALKEREIQGQFVGLAISILRDSPHGDTTRAVRAWAVEILNRYSGVPISTELQNQLQTRLAFPERPAAVAPANPPDQ